MPAPRGRSQRPRGGPAPAPKRKRSAFGWLSLISSGAMTAAFVALAAVLLFIVESNRPGPTPEDSTFVVPRGASVTSIARALDAEGHINAALFFRAAAAIYANGKSLQAGEYAIPAHAPLREIVDLIANGRAVQHGVTIAEGLTSAAALDIIAQSEVLTGDVPPMPAEGTLLPETYHVQRGMDRTVLVQQMQQAQADLMAEIWPRRAPGLPFTTQEEAIILASIVEREAGGDEHSRVAAVFVNRLRRGMPLQSDPTIIYGVCQQFPARCVNGRLVNERTGRVRTIRQSEIDMNTGYNTYRIPALPPTPIANPGRASLEAVLNPPRTNDLFFVADGTGGHAFAATVAEHNRNVARWREIERERLAAER